MIASWQLADYSFIFPITAQLYLDQQQQHCLKEKCRKALLRGTAFLSILRQKAAEKVSFDQPGLLAPYVCNEQCC